MSGLFFLCIFVGMKPCLFILIMVFAIMVGCTPKGDNDVVETRHGTSLPTMVSPELATVDSLMWVQPDSALACLLPYFDTCCRDAARQVSTVYNRHYAHLLLAELLYKNDYAQTNRTELLEAVTYFDSLTLNLNDHPHAFWRHCGLDPQSPDRDNTLFFLDARAHYINGVGYYEHDSVVEACKEYFKALGVMEGHIGIMMLKGHMAHFLALDYTRLNTIYSGFYLHEQAIFFARQSIVWFQKSESSQSNKAWMLGEIGVNYDMMEQLDSARYYYNEAMKVLDDERILLYRDMTAHQICLEYKSGTKHCDSVLLELHRLLTESVSEEEYLVRCSHIGEVFYHERRFDSASHYLKLVYCRSDKEGLKKQAAEWLVEICNSKGEKAEATEYTSFLAPYANQEENNSNLKSSLISCYTEFKQNESDKRYKTEITKQTNRQRMITFAMIIIVIITIIAISFKNRRKKQKLKAQIEVERQAHKTQQAALAGRLKRSNDELKKTTKNKNRFEGIHVQASCFTDNYEEEPICKHILTVCNDTKNPIKSTIPISEYATIALTDAQKAQLKAAALHHYGHLFDQLGQDHPELKEKDYYYCYLCLLGLDNVQIAALLQKSISTIWDREKRLQKILGAGNKIAITLNDIFTD